MLCKVCSTLALPPTPHEIVAVSAPKHCSGLSNTGVLPRFGQIRKRRGDLMYQSVFAIAKLPTPRTFFACGVNGSATLYEWIRPALWQYTL